MLKNVRLETGFEYDGDEVIATKTGLFCVEIADGKIKSVTPNNPAAKAIDAKVCLCFLHLKICISTWTKLFTEVRGRQ